jgi:hypothetical protein
MIDETSRIHHNLCPIYSAPWLYHALDFENDVDQSYRLLERQELYVMFYLFIDGRSCSQTPTADRGFLTCYLICHGYMTSYLLYKYRPFFAKTSPEDDRDMTWRT